MNDELAAHATVLSRFKKERYLLAMSEEEFRDRVVRPLLLRRGLKDGRDLCGPDEAGKDAAFLSENRLGHDELYVVQTKKGPLNLARKASTNIVEAITQLRTALVTKVALTTPRSKRLPDKVILAASGKINVAARGHIVDEVSDPRVTFLDSDELIPQIDQYLPEVWFDIDVAIRPYLKELKRSVEDIAEDLLPPSPNGAKVSAATDKMFVNLYLHRTEIKIRRRKGQVDQEPEIKELPLTAILNRQERLIVITGGAGSGKSTALRRLAYVLIQRALASPDIQPVIPVLVRAATLAAVGAAVLGVCADESMRLTETRTPAFGNSDLTAGRVVILVDALDELASNDDRSEVLRRLRGFHSDYPKCQVIVTSRDYSFIKVLKDLAAFNRFSLSPIGLPQAEQLLLKIQKDRKLPAESSREILRRLQDIHGLELNPLLVTVFAATSDVSRKDIPANITELFKKFTEMLLGRWDQNKGLGQQYHAPVKDFLLRQVAFEMHRRRITALPREEFRQMVSSALEARGMSPDLDQLWDEMVDRSGMFRSVSDTIEFRHLLLQEFFAGRGIPSADMLETVIADEWWQRAIVFYFGEHADDVDGLNLIRTAVGPRPDSEKYRSAITLGLALQACYLIETKHRAEILSWIIQIIARAKAAVIQSNIDAGIPPLIAFIWYYVFGRDSVACSMPEAARGLLSHELEGSAKTSDEADTVRFWEIIGGIECGITPEVELLIRQFLPTDRRLLFGVYISLRFAEHLRISTTSHKAIARRLADKIHDVVGPEAREFSKEFKTVLLELRRGELVEVAPHQLAAADETDGH